MDPMELYEQRLLVLLEGEDGVFRQVLLNEDSFKRVSDAIFDVHEEQHEDLRDGYEIGEINLNEDWEIDADKFIGLTSIYEENSD